MKGIFRAWGRILNGYKPNLSIEVTRECPLRCPGCYAYGADHHGGDVAHRAVSDFRGDDLVNGIVRVVREHRPIHVSLVGGEPLVRYRELNKLLPQLANMGVHTQVVTSAVRPIPREWAGLRRLQICVSIDGLPPEHDLRRAPATYDRILKHIDGHAITVHCTVTRQQARRDGYTEEFVALWSQNPQVHHLWVSLYTPQVGEVAPEVLTPDDRARVIAELREMAPRYPKLQASSALLNVYAEPPSSPDECIFARTTTCLSPDLQKPIAPCQFGGRQDCSQCGCMAAAGLGAVGRHRLPGGVKVGTVFALSERVGRTVRSLRGRFVAAAMS